MKETLRKALDMEKAKRNIRMDQSTRVSISIIKCMVKESRPGCPESFLKENLRMV
jgi:hypothetical protein